jgi:hypothetical protein
MSCLSINFRKILGNFEYFGIPSRKEIKNCIWAEFILSKQSKISKANLYFPFLGPWPKGVGPSIGLSSLKTLSHH